MFSRPKLFSSLLIASLIIGSKPLLAAPTITAVDTSQIAQNLITITGTGFGNASTVNVHDTFEHPGAVTGDFMALNQAIDGTWEDRDIGNLPRYDNFALSGNHSINTWDPINTRAAQIAHDFTNPVQSVFLSYWVAIPNGYPFPGWDAAYNGFSGDSSWKFAWLIDQDYLGNSSDVCVPTHTGQGYVKIAGNDGNIDWGMSKMQNWWSWGNWVRISAWLHADPANPAGSGRLRFSTWSAEHGFDVYDKNQPVFDADGPATKQYQYINIPGWIRSFTHNNGRPLYDDVYVSSGINAYARVELTDNTNYNNSNKFAIQKITSWSDTSITFKVLNANISNVNTASIHVFNGNGDSTSSGTPVGHTAPANPPLPPPNFTITPN
jgi:hypothetical protein